MSSLWRRATTLLTVVTLGSGLFIGAGSAAQGAQGAAVGTIKSAGCSTGVQWRLGYRMYFRNSHGGTLERGASVKRAKAELQEFADRVGQWTACEARVKIELFDEGDAVYGNAFGAAEKAWTINRGFDSTMFRYPDFGERAQFVGETDYQNVKLPVTKSDEQETYYGSPYFMTIIHEWLHVVWNQTQVAKANVTWPRNDVHASFNAYQAEGYDGAVRFYHDLVSGQYMEDGRATGMRPGSWTATGTPTSHSKPSASPTSKPSASPTSKPSASPTSKPSASGMSRY